MWKFIANLERCDQLPVAALERLESIELALVAAPVELEEELDELEVRRFSQIFGLLINSPKASTSCPAATGCRKINWTHY